MIKFKASSIQLSKLLCLAVNASKPVSGITRVIAMSHPSNFEPDEFIGRNALDYYAGRMVKLYCEPDGEGYWLIHNEEPNIEYQSWAEKYPSYEELLEAAEILEYEVNDTSVTTDD